MTVLLCLCFIFVGSTIAGKHDMYSGYTVHGVKLQDSSHQRILLNLELELDVDIWQHGVPKLRDAIVMVSPENKLAFLDTLYGNDIKHYLRPADVARNLEESDEDILRWKMSKGSQMSMFEKYPTYGEIEEYMEKVARENPSLVQLVNAGPSFEGRPVKYLKISTTNFKDTSKPIYFLEATMHAREWVTTQIALYSIHRLVENLRTKDKDILENTDWIILPVVNPDGYEFSHTIDRMWRKTRSFNASISVECYGADPNRNFDIEFNTISVSSNPCSNNYPGHKAFSEVETEYVRDILLEYTDRIQVFMDVHSFGNYIVYGFDNGTLPQNALHIYHTGALMGATIDSLKLPKAPYYIVGNSKMVFYAVSGSGQDYAQAVGVGFSYTLEMPGYEYGFQVPSSYINQLNMETWEGIAVSARVAQKYYKQVELDVDVWEYGLPEVIDALIMVSPENRLTFLDMLVQNGISHYLHSSNVVESLEDTEPELSKWEMRRSNSIFQNYLTYTEVDAYLERIAKEKPRIVKLVNVGTSFEGRPIKYLKISSTNFTDISKPIYFIDAAMHGREWITLPPALYTIHRLVENLRDGDKDLLNDIDWIVLPIVNPDGYIYSHTDDRLWRHTRSYNATISTVCYGVDPNRNFDVNFEGAGSTTTPLDRTFRGFEPFSKAETRYVRNILLEHVNRIQVYLNAHSHGNLIIYSYGNGTLPSNSVHLHLVASIMGAAIDSKKLFEAPFYEIGNGANVLYEMSGSAQDYGQKIGVPFSYIVELPGMGHGFLVPPSYINQVNIETWEGIAASARVALKYYKQRY